MNGWQRLWVLATLILSVLALAGYAHVFPGSSKIDTSYSNNISKLNEGEFWAQFEEVKPAQKKGQLTFDDLPNENQVQPRQLTFDDLIPKKSSAQLKEEARVKYDKLRQEARAKYDLELSALSENRWTLAIRVLTIWFLICASLYGLGWMINWVYRGFRPKAV